MKRFSNHIMILLGFAGLGVGVTVFAYDRFVPRTEFSLILEQLQIIQADVKELLKHR